MKPKQFLFTIVLFLSVAFIKAQDKYEFAIIEFATFRNYISVSIDGKEFTSEKVEYIGQEKSGYNANPILLKVKEYQDKGWEVMSFNSSINGNTADEVHFAHLRKKIK